MGSRVSLIGGYEIEGRDGHYLIRTAARDFVAFVGLDETAYPGRWPRILLPIRSAGPEVPETILLHEGVRQTKRLLQKLRVVSNLQLSPGFECAEFGAARVLFSFTKERSESDAWTMAGACLQDLQRLVAGHLVVQSDYDQKQYHHLLGGPFDALDFKTAHEPSAIGTTLCFRELLNEYGAGERPLGLIGVGELGQRILSHLLNLGTPRIIVCDINEARLAQACTHVAVSSMHIDSLIRADVAGVIFCANAGSLTHERAKALASNHSLVAVGGPEAGLDSDDATITRLTTAGKHFIPSMLCGAMGLLANLQELSGLAVDVRGMGERLEAIVSDMIGEAKSKHKTFHEVFLSRFQPP